MTAPGTSAPRDDMPESRASTLVAAIALLGFGVFAAVLVLRMRPLWVFTVDDTFITLRYARHLAQGLGPAWNPGGPKVEGCTTTLWMLLMAIPHLWQWDALLWAKGASTLCALLCAPASAWLALRTVRELSVYARASAIVTTFALFTAYWSLALHAVSGMETTLFALLITLYFLYVQRVREELDPSRARLLALSALLITLVRPEGALICGTAFVVLVVQVDAAQKRTLLRALALYTVAPGAAYFALRYAYYGLPLPLPFYVKAQGQDRFAGVEDVQLFFAPFVTQQPYLCVLMLLGAARFAKRLLPACMAAAALVLFFVFLAHIMGYEGRYLFPVFPLLAALLGVGCAQASEWLGAWLGGRNAPRALALIVPFAVCGALARWPLPDWQDYEKQRWIRYGDGLARAHIPLGHDLGRMRAQGHAGTIALLDVGAIGYYGEWFTVDTYGLNDVRMALSRRADLAYVFRQAPELVVVVSSAQGRYEPVFDHEAPLHAAAAARGYTFACDYEFLSDCHLHVLARPGSTSASQLSCMKR